MSIRHVNKDHLKELAPTISLVASGTTDAADAGDPLRFWTKHPKEPCLVDLTPFRDGQLHLPNGRWGGPFRGRPTLIHQLAPALREIYLTAAEGTIGTVRSSLRFWWRLFDTMEAAAPPGISVASVVDVSDVTELHRQVAFEFGLNRTTYGPFVRALDLSRRGLGLRPLHWVGPEAPDVIRHLPAFEQIKPIRDSLKRGWYAALDRWERAEQLLGGAAPESETEVELLANYRHFQEVANALGKACPKGVDLFNERSGTFFYARGYRFDTMVRGLYPDADDIRAAFHLCLVTTGWNPATFLSLNVDEPFIEPHPRDTSRYLLTGYKERSRTTQVTEGLFKCQRSAGVILKTLMARTGPLREQLRAQHAEAAKEYGQLRNEGSPQALLDAKRGELVDLEAGLRSPWLFVTQRGITWLAGNSYQRVGLDGYLERLIDGLNALRPPERQVPKLTASDFRDAFAAYAYQESGGMVLYVMRVLGHKKLSSTQRYIDNTLLNDVGARVFHSFGNTLWSEIKLTGRLDPSVVAKWCRDGQVTDDERQRLDDYRALKRSRLGVACRNPTQPSKNAAPGFKPDGKSLCTTQRCTLCENAVILPESLSGLAMRKAELLHLQMVMPVSAFTESSFDEELRNIEIALLGFDQAEVAIAFEEWRRRIASGEHRVIHLELIEEFRA